MRLAILSDIHGNPVALDAVLADIQSQGEVDAYWVLGDFAALGYDPVTPLEKITALSHANFTRGNTDRYVVTQELPVQPEKALEDPALLPEVIVAARSFSWTRGYLSAAGWLDWLTNVPLEVRPGTSQCLIIPECTSCPSQLAIFCKGCRQDVSSIL